MTVRPWIATLTLGALVGVGCETYTPPPPMPEDQAQRSAGFGSSGSSVFDDGAKGAQAEDATPSERKPEDGPYIVECWLHPDPPIASRALRADPRVDNPAPGSARVSYTWWVNDEEQRSVRGETLPRGSFKRDDRISVEVTATDINKRSDSFKFSDIIVSNSTPQIVSQLGMEPRLDGFVFQAVDPDGDPLKWRIEGAPPGVTIGSRSGEMRIDTTATFADGNYTMTIYAADPAGGEGEMRFAAALSGSKGETQVEVEVPDGEIRHQSTFSDDEYIERTEKFLDRMDDMSEEEFEKYLERSEEAMKELEAVGATEIPGNDQAPPFPGTAPASDDGR